MMPDTTSSATSKEDAKLLAEYQEVNANFRALAEIRFKLLALVPTVTGLGVALIDQRTGAESTMTALLSAIGIVVLVGIVAYDQRNSQFYNRLVGRAQFLEMQMELPKAGAKSTDRPIGIGGGQFLDRQVEPRRLFGFLPLWHDFGLGLIYSAAMGGWLFLLSRWGLLRADVNFETANRVAAVVAVGCAAGFLKELVRLAAKPKQAP